MTIEIVTRTANSEAQQRAKITVDSLRRSFDNNGGSWTKARVALRYSSSWNSWSAAPLFYCGLMFGTSNPPGGAGTVEHYLGLKCTGTWYTGGTATAAYMASCRTVNGTETVAGLGDTSETNGIAICDHASGCHFLAIDFLKGSPNWTMTVYGTSYNNGIAQPMTLAQFQEKLTSPTPSDAPAYGVRLLGSVDIAIDEAINGALDTAVFTWLGSTYDFEISDFMAQVMY